MSTSSRKSCQDYSRSSGAWQISTCQYRQKLHGKYNVVINENSMPGSVPSFILTTFNTTRLTSTKTMWSIKTTYSLFNKLRLLKLFDQNSLFYCLHSFSSSSSDHDLLILDSYYLYLYDCDYSTNSQITFNITIIYSICLEYVSIRQHY